jgi:hypothetical protein
LYYRELIARFAHHHALLWDLSEEMDRWRYYKADDVKELCNFIKKLDPWQHPIQYVQWKGELLPDEKGYGRLLGFPNFDGTALQHDPEFTHQATRKWVDLSAAAGHKWLVGLVEINPTSTGVLPDNVDYWHDTIRKKSLWGNLMAGGSGTVFFFGYGYPNGDLDVEDWRSRDHFWDLLHYAHEFFIRHLPFPQMQHADELTPNPNDFVFARKNEVYAIYLPDGGTAQLDLTGATGTFEVRWYDPRFGGELQRGTVNVVEGGASRALGEAPNERSKDWVMLVRRQSGNERKSSASGQAIPPESNLLVKLRVPVGIPSSHTGDRIQASVISPESYLGGSLEGAVQECSVKPQPRITLAFDTLRFKDKQFSVRAMVTHFVNSKGHKLVDEEERPAHVENGVIVSEGGEFLLNEGAELTLRAASMP